jgi:hypothetical protein
MPGDQDLTIPVLAAVDGEVFDGSRTPSGDSRPLKGALAGADPAIALPRPCAVGGDHGGLEALRRCVQATAVRSPFGLPSPLRLTKNRRNRPIPISSPS